MINRNALWTWLDQHPTFYFSVVGGLITLALFMAIVPLCRANTDSKRGHDWIWGFLIVVILAAGRWPSIVFPRELNADESQMLAGAHTLLRDPVFWRSVDGGTAGPMNYFPLWPAGWLLGGETFIAARITALTLLAITLVLAHQCMAIILGRKVARVAILAAVCLEALTNAKDLLHYSTEIMSVVLLTVAAYAAVRRWVDQKGPLWNGLGGLVLGAVPLAKLQAVPLAACLGLGWLLAEILGSAPHRARRITYLVGGAIFPVTLFACQLTLAGEWDSFLTSYVSSNIRYSGFGRAPLGPLLMAMFENSMQMDSLLHLWVPGSVIWLVLMLRLGRGPDRATQAFTLAGFAATVLAVFCICYPKQNFLHYWQLAIVPVTFFLGALMGRLHTSPHPWKKRDRWLVAVCACSLVSAMLVQRARQPNLFLGYHSFFEQMPVTELSSRIIPHVRADDSIAIWGWSNYVYVETGLRQATRDAIVFNFVERGPHRNYFRERFLNDFTNALPTFFLDSIGPFSLRYNDPVLAHDHDFPALAAVIRSHYRLIQELDGARLYQRKDLVNR